MKSLLFVTAFICTNFSWLPGKVLISEVLFNPRAGGVDFVEIYNHSTKTLDLRDLYVGSVDRNRQINNVLALTTTSYAFYPGTYLVLTTRPDVVKAHYPNASEHALVAVAKLPNFNNNEGTVLILHKNSTMSDDAGYQVLDSLYYFAAMHAGFLKNTKGISLERQDFNIATNVPGNFGSAALSTGGATPGYGNTHMSSDKTGIRLKTRVVSPNYDGINDKLELHYTISEPHLMATIRIYDVQGRMIRTLMHHISIPSHGIWIWDGTTDRHQPVSEGIYTIVIELYNARGFRQIHRKSFVIVRQK